MVKKITGNKMVNDKYSYKDFTGVDLSSESAADFNGTEIVGSCFAQEASYDAGSLGQNPLNPSVNPFPPSMNGVTFTRCNLDNCIVIANNVVGDRSINRNIRVMNDLEDWVLDKATNKPLDPTNKAIFESLGLSTDPLDIPSTKQDEPITKNQGQP